MGWARNVLSSNRLVRKRLQGRQELGYVLRDGSGCSVRNGLHGSKVEDPARDDGELDQGDGRSGDQQWLHSVYILKVGVIRSVDRLVVEHETEVIGPYFHQGQRFIA